MSEVIVCGRCLTDSDHRWLLGSILQAKVCGRCQGQAVWRLDARVEEPRLAYAGVASVFSTDTSLLPYLPVKWDVNGYYALLGVSPDATRVDIRRAYMAALDADHPDMARVTYVTKQLLDSEVRATYDRCQPGEVYFDEYVRQFVLRRAKQAAAEALARGEVSEDEVEALDFADQIGRVVEVLDKPARQGQTGGGLNEAWGYYLWKSSRVDHETLAQWRYLICVAAEGQLHRLGVGFHQGGCPVEVQEVDGVPVAFINESVSPTPSLAEQVMERLSNNQTA